MKSYLNIENTLESICWILFAAILFYLTYTEKYLLFVTPRMEIYLYFTSLITFLFGLSSLLQIEAKKRKINVVHFFVLILPTLSMLLPYTTLQSQDVRSQYSAAFSDTKQTNTSSQAAASTTEIAASTEETSASSTETTQGESESLNLDGLNKEKKTITVADTDFYKWLLELGTNPEKYDGFTVHIHGTVYRDNTLKGNEFALTRLLMTCCTADLVPYGPICIWEDSSNLKKDSWINVTGTYHYDDTNGIEIIVKNVEKAKAAKEKYVYPF